VTTSPSTVHKRKTSQGTKWATSAKGQALGFPVPGTGRALPRDWTGRKEDELTSQAQTPIPTTVEDTIDEPEPTVIEAPIEEPRYSFRKRKMPMDEEEAHRSKIAKAMIAITDSLDKDDTELALIAAQFDLDIPIPRAYEEAVNDKTYGQ